VSIAASLHLKGNNSMPESNTTTTETAVADVQASLRAAALAENHRIGEINTICAAHPAYNDVQAKQVADIQAQAIQNGWTPIKAEAEVIKATLPKGPAIHASSRDLGGDEDTLLRAAATLHLAGDGATEKIYGERVAEGARRLGARSIIGICEAGLRMRGENVPRNSHELLKASFSTLNLPGILGDSANKILQNEYRQLPSVARTTCRKLSASNFKTTTGYRLGANATFEELGDGGEIKHGTLDESSFTFKLATYAKMYALTRQTIINDDLDAFAQLPRIIARGGVMKLENAWATLLLSNPGSFFSAGNKNYISGVETALNMVSLRSALALFRSSVDANGDPILNEPKYLLVPPELEIDAKQMVLGTTTLGDDNVIIYEKGNSNPFYKMVEPLVSPHLSNANITGNSDAAWYLWGNPADVAAMGVAYLDDMESPTFETSDSDFNTLGMQFRGFFDFAVCMIESQGAVKSKGGE
jgi:hypothetical protein